VVTGYRLQSTHGKRALVNVGRVLRAKLEYLVASPFVRGLGRPADAFFLKLS
jgi:hypothetical protein